MQFGPHLPGGRPSPSPPTGQRCRAKGLLKKAGILPKASKASSRRPLPGQSVATTPRLGREAEHALRKAFFHKAAVPNPHSPVLWRNALEDPCYTWTESEACAKQQLLLWTTAGKTPGTPSRSSPEFGEAQPFFGRFCSTFSPAPLRATRRWPSYQIESPFAEAPEADSSRNRCVLLVSPFSLEIPCSLFKQAGHPDTWSSAAKQVAFPTGRAVAWRGCSI